MQGKVFCFKSLHMRPNACWSSPLAGTWKFVAAERRVPCRELCKLYGHMASALEPRMRNTDLGEHTK